MVSVRYRTWLKSIAEPGGRPVSVGQRRRKTRYVTATPPSLSRSSPRRHTNRPAEAQRSIANPGMARRRTSKGGLDALHTRIHSIVLARQFKRVLTIGSTPAGELPSFVSSFPDGRRCVRGGFIGSVITHHNASDGAFQASGILGSILVLIVYRSGAVSLDHPAQFEHSLHRTTHSFDEQTTAYGRQPVAHPDDHAEAGRVEKPHLSGV